MRLWQSANGTDVGSEARVRQTCISPWICAKDRASQFISSLSWTPRTVTGSPRPNVSRNADERQAEGAHASAPNVTANRGGRVNVGGHVNVGERINIGERAARVVARAVAIGAATRPDEGEPERT
eukprot:1353093-Pleurochrysis_carterae.AAC.3